MVEVPRATAEELLAHEGWIRSLALTLVRDVSSAEDVVQETWLAALRRPPTTDRPLRPWLARVVRNFAYERRRQDRRTILTDVDPEPNVPVPAADDEAAQGEMRVLLVEAVLAMREPYRTVLVLRFWGGLEPHEIAERQGIPPPTVRTRLRRGLAELRERVGTKWEGGEHGAWSVLVALAGLREGLVGPGAGTGAAAAPAAGSGVKLVLGALGAGAVVVAGAALLRPDRAERPRAEGPAAVAARPEPADVRPRIERAPVVGERPAAALAARPAGGSSAAPWTRAELDALEVPLEPGEVEVLVFQGREPAAGEAVVLAPGERVRLDRPWEDLPSDARLATTDAEGRARFEDVPDGDYHVGVRRPGASFQRLMRMGGRRSPRRAVFVYADGALEGRAFDVDGSPHAQAVVRLAWLREEGVTNSARQQIWLETDGDGRFAVEGLPGGAYCVTMKVREEVGRWWWFDVERPLTLPEGERATVQLGVPRPWPVWTGVIRNRAGAPVAAKAHLRMRHVETETTLLETTDEDGTFSFRALPGLYDDLSVELRDGPNRSLFHLPAFEVSRTQTRDITLPGARLWGRVELPEGRDGARLEVLLYPEEGRPLITTVDHASGTYAFEGVAPGPWRLRTRPLKARGADGGPTVDVRAEDVELRVDVAVGG